MLVLLQCKLQSERKTDYVQRFDRRIYTNERIVEVRIIKHFNQSKLLWRRRKKKYEASCEYYKCEKGNDDCEKTIHFIRT